MTRIDYISSLAGKYKTIADVGADHAFVSIKAIKDYGTSYAYALDINDGPLQNARCNINDAGLNNNIETIKSDGLINLSVVPEAIVIAGMGGELIIKIINDSIDKARKAKALILSPNNDEEALRRYLSENGFTITDENIIYDKGHYYEIIIAAVGNSNLDRLDIKFGPILRNEKNDIFIKKYTKKHEMLKNAYQNASNERKEELQAEINLIEEVL